MAFGKKSCELCGGEASVHCDPDSAFLCWTCDARVHGANFLASRHGRHFLCPECGSLDLENTPLFFGPSLSRNSFSPCCCSSSSSESRSSSSSRASSRRVSPVRRRRRRRSGGELDARVDLVLEEWCRRLGLGSGAAAAASHALVVGMRRGKAWPPLRVGMAAAVWFAAKLHISPEARVLRVLEGFSGVPAKLISLGEAKICKSLGWCQAAEHSEGWADNA